MFRHNLLIIFRNFRRNKNSFLINIIGLSTGLACALLIYLWVDDELNMDKFHEKDDRLYQVMLNMQGPNGVETLENTPGLLAQALAEEMSEIEYTAAVIPTDWGFGNQGLISFENVQLKTNEQYVSRDYFHLFSYRLLEGNVDQVLSGKNSILISDKIAEKLFGSIDNALGQTINWERTIFNVQFSGNYLITGVFEKPPSSSTTQFDVVFNYELFFDKWAKNIKKWTNQNPYTYVLLKEGINVEHFNNRLAGFLKTKIPDTGSTLFIRKYSDKYLYGNYENGMEAGGRIEYVKLFSIIALFILVIGCINFMNLTTAKASGRLKELGIKKTVGADRKRLIFQFLCESLALAFLSLIIALVLVEVLLPQFNQITGKHLSLSFNLNVILAALSITLFTGFVSGSYPALYISGFKPIAILKGKHTTSHGEVLMRKGLVIFQFVVSVILIVSVMVIYGQIEFIQTKNLGFSKDNVICFSREGKLEKNFNTFLPELKKITGVINASNSISNLTGFYSSTTGGITFNESNNIRFASMDVNYDFFETLDMDIKEGRTFSKEFGSESSNIIFNETGIRLLGITDPIGKTVQLWGKSRQIIGVVRDFHFESLYDEVKPCFFRIINPEFNFGNNVWVKIKAGTEKETIAQIRKLYNEFNPGLLFEYSFLDKEFQNLYESENRVAILSKYFAGIAIIISCLGLFGLAAFTAERRTKEIGVRKVLGSSTLGIISLLSGDFTKIVLASLLISLPVSYLITNNWLNSFAYRIDLQVWYFISAGLASVIVAWLTVGIQAIKAASANPIDSLKYE